MAELADALDSGSSPSNGVQVQLLSWAPFYPRRNSAGIEPKLSRSQPASTRNSRIPHIGKKRPLEDLLVMKDTRKVTYKNLSASIKYYLSDGLFHAYWNNGGIKEKAAHKIIQGQRPFRLTWNPSRVHCPSKLQVHSDRLFSKSSAGIPNQTPLRYRGRF